MEAIIPDLMTEHGVRSVLFEIMSWVAIMFFFGLAILAVGED